MSYEKLNKVQEIGSKVCKHGITIGQCAYCNNMGAENGEIIAERNKKTLKRSSKIAERNR